MKKKDVIINIEPFHSEIRRFEGGFKWTFIHDMGEGRRKRVNVKCERWWLVYLAQQLRKVLEEEEAELQRIKELVGFK